jgi:hypothetical protein
MVIGLEEVAATVLVIEAAAGGRTTSPEANTIATAAVLTRFRFGELVNSPKNPEPVVTAAPWLLKLVVPKTPSVGFDAAVNSGDTVVVAETT